MFNLARRAALGLPHRAGEVCVGLHHVAAIREAAAVAGVEMRFRGQPRSQQDVVHGQLDTVIDDLSRRLLPDRGIVAEVARGIGTPSRNSAWSGETSRSRCGTPGAIACARMRAGNTSCGLGWCASSTRRWL